MLSPLVSTMDDSVKRSISAVLIAICPFCSFSFRPIATAMRCSHGL